MCIPAGFVGNILYGKKTGPGNILSTKDHAKKIRDGKKLILLARMNVGIGVYRCVVFWV